MPSFESAGVSHPTVMLTLSAQAGAVGQFLLGVLVLHQAFGLAVASDIDPHAGIAVPGEVGMHHLVAGRRAIALAIGQVFQDRRNRVVFGIGRQPHPRRQSAAVRQSNHPVLNLPHPARQLPNLTHPQPPEIGSWSDSLRTSGASIASLAARSRE